MLNLVGLDPADIEVDNFRDGVIGVNITRTDAQGNPKVGGISFRITAC